LYDSSILLNAANLIALQILKHHHYHLLLSSLPTHRHAWENVNEQHAKIW
uniref:VapC toxin family PIN domain ribonuclease n=1 Tax=Brugia timori TaxID=42155 RepID=A0A0R3QQ89_9BILA